MSRDKVIVKDPTVVSATDTDSKHHKDEIPLRYYESVAFFTPDGEKATVRVGDELHTASEHHGTVTKIVKQADEGGTSTWQWTVYFDYTNSDSAEGGVPLGELATQLDEGAFFQ